MAVGGLAMLAGCGASADRRSSHGTEVVVEARPAAGATVAGSDIDRSAKIMRRRLDTLGIRASVGRVDGSERIVLRFDGLSAGAARRYAGAVVQPGGAAFYDLTPSLLPPSIDEDLDVVAFTSLHTLLRSARSAERGSTAFYLFATKTGNLVKGPAATRAELPLGLEGGVGKRREVLAAPANSLVIACGADVAVVCPGVFRQPEPGVTYYYLFKNGARAGKSYPGIDGRDVRPASVKVASDPVSHFAIVAFELTPRGNRLFQQLTLDEAVRGRALGKTQSLAIVLDNRLYSSPTIDYRVFPTGIDATAGGVQITGLSSRAEAKRVAAVLRSGALPVPFAVASLRSFS